VQSRLMCLCVSVCGREGGSYLCYFLSSFIWLELFTNLTLGLLQAAHLRNGDHRTVMDAVAATF